MTKADEGIRAWTRRTPGRGAGPAVSVIIKTLNEEARVARAIESALAALEGLSGEVILADSLSTDRTTGIARAYPVTVVQLADPRHRRCGAGPQLGFQHARGDLIYVLDGDMELDRDFLARATAFLADHPRVVGVAGLVEELGGGNYEFEARKSQGASWGVAGVQPWLEMGGLYRRAAVVAAGWLSDRNLHACEEQDLGLRLGSQGGQLVRLPIPGVRHHGRRESSWTLMRRRLARRYSDGPGEVLRAAWGRPHWRAVLASHRLLALMAAVWAAVAAGLLLLPASPLPLAAAGAVFVALGLVMSLRKRSLAAGLVGFVNWQMRTLGFVRGLLARRVDPRLSLPDRVLAQAGDGRPREARDGGR